MAATTLLMMSACHQVDRNVVATELRMMSDVNSRRPGNLLLQQLPWLRWVQFL